MNCVPKVFFFLLFFLSVSPVCFAQDDPPPVAMPKQQNLPIIDELIAVTAFKSYFLNYCERYITEAAQERGWNDEVKKLITVSADFKYFKFNVQNLLALKSRKELLNLIEGYRKAPVESRRKNIIINSDMIQYNLKAFCRKLVRGSYMTREQSASLAKLEGGKAVGKGTRAEYPGGINAFNTYIDAAYQKQAIAAKTQASGRVIVHFVIDRDGSLTDISIKNDLGFGTGDILREVLSRSPKWTPAVENGRPIRDFYTIPIVLRTPDINTRLTSYPRPGTDRELKLAPVDVSNNLYYFEHHREKCNLSKVKQESGRQLLSDRFSVLNQVVNSINKDSIPTLLGRVSYQLVVDSIGKACVASFKNETNMAERDLNIADVLESKIIWRLSSPASTDEVISTLLVFTFTQDRVRYQHMAFGKHGKIEELESAQKSKLAAW